MMKNLRGIMREAYIMILLAIYLGTEEIKDKLLKVLMESHQDVKLAV